VPIWSRQIAEGGPVTVTHPEMTRYFMTIPEAAQLVIQAGALTEAEAAGADVFVLDMGRPVRIVELAERFVRQAGLEPSFVDRAAGPGAGVPGGMEIVFTGARPGEKLHEELAYTGEELRPTPAQGVLAWAWSTDDSLAGAERLTADLEAVRWSADHHEVLSTIARHAPTLAAARPQAITSQERANPRSDGSSKFQAASGRRQNDGAPVESGVIPGPSPTAA
jgi:FlaA1/EpsC-like NDP-sugar epimerase